MSAGETTQGRQRVRSSRALRWIVGIVLVCLVMVAGAAAYVGSVYQKLEQTTVMIGTDEEIPLEQRASKKPISLLILGTDYRAKTRSANTDVIMVATLNPEKKTATVVSIPRDTFIDPKGLQGGKANSFYAAYLYSRSFKDAPKEKEERQAYAMKNVREVYSRYLAVPIDYTVVVNFQTFIDIIDAYGGITLHVDQSMCYHDHADDTHIVLSEGVQKLDGKKTLDFVRYRKSQNCKPRTKSSSDFERNARQQRVISALLEKVLTPQGLLGIGDVLQAVGKNVATDIPSKQILEMMETYVAIDKSNIAFLHLEGRWDGHYVKIAQEDIEKSTQALNRQMVLTETEQAQTQTIQSFPPADAQPMIDAPITTPSPN